MKRVKNFNIAKESFEDMCKSRRFNPCLESVFETGGASTIIRSAPGTMMKSMFTVNTEKLSF